MCKCLRICLPLLVLQAGCSIGLDAMPEVEEGLMDGELVYFEDRGDYLAFLPRQVFHRVGIVFYPGALVEAEAYTPWLRVLAQRGYPAAVARFPLRVAVLKPNRANRILAELEDDADAWVVAGHSLGGAVAARFVNRAPPGTVRGLALLAAYPGPADDLSGSDVAVLSLYGTRDGIVTPEEIRNSAPLLPLDARFVAIEGGNHAQFGWYGAQPSDNPATISRDAQQAVVIAEVTALLESISGAAPDAM